MSTNISWTDIRRALGDPLSAQVRALINKQNMFIVQQEQAKTQRARGIGRATSSRLTLRDPFTYGFSSEFKLTGENQYAILLDGINDNIALGTNANAWNSNLDAFTVSFWIRPDIITDTNHREICQRGWATPFGFDVYFLANTPRLEFEVVSDTWPTRIVSQYIDFTGKPVDEWYHITCVYDKNDATFRGRSYLNGVYSSTQVTNAAGQTLVNASAMLLAGIANDYAGYIQDFRWWNSARSASDILDLYEGDYIGQLPDYWLRMNEGSGNPYDVVGGTLQGTLTNGAAWAVAPQSPLYRYFMPPMEPDGVFLTCWIPMKSMGRYLEDLSHFKNHAYMKGRPLMCNGPDDGLYGGRIALEFNHTPGKDDYLYIPHASKLDTSLVATGICIFVRVKFNELEQDGGIDQTVFQKIDNTGATAGLALRVGTDGKLKWYPRRSSSTFDHITAAGTVIEDTIYDIGVRYALSGNVTQVHVDGVSKSDTGSDPITFPVNDATDLRIGIGDNADVGRCPATFYDFRVYYEYLISTAEWLNLYTNKRSISTIPYGLVAAEGITQLEYKPPHTSGYSAGYTH